MRAAPGLIPAPVDEPEHMETAQQLSAVLLILALLGSAAWALKKKRLTLARPTTRLQVLERVALTPHHSLCLVRVDGRVLIAATAPNGTQILNLKDAPAE